MDKQLYCGAARRNVNPPDELIDRFPDRRSHTFIDDLFLRVIALSDGETKVLIIAYDSGYSCIDDQFAVIEERFGIGSDNVMILDTHSHTKMYGGYQFGNLPPNPRKHFHEFHKWPQDEQDAMNEYGAITRKLMVEAVEEALANLRPARLGHAKGQSYINASRNQRYVIELPDGTLEDHYTLGVDLSKPVDHTVFVMKFEDIATSKPIAFFINYPVHNIAMISNLIGADGKKAWSSDIGGNCCQYMEAKYPGCTALWTSGAAGDINPIIANQVVYPDPMTGAPTRFFPKESELALVSLKMLSTRHFADIMETVRKIDHMTDKTELKTVVEISATPGLDGENVVHEGLYKIRMQTFRIGDVALLGVSGELYDSFAKLIMATSPLKDTIIINHVGVGTVQSEYIMDDWVFEHTAPPEERHELGPRDKNNLATGLADCIVGTEHTQIVPGYLAHSLKKHTISIFDKLL